MAWQASNADLDKDRAERDRPQLALKNVYQVASGMTTKAYKLAQEALKLNDELIFSDKEIDKFFTRTVV